METKTRGISGRVSLIGAGPGAADLITLRGARLLGEADVVLHDALVSPELFQHCPQAALIAVGKRCGRHSTAQRFINRQLVELARRYPRVVRLKGGDPMLFGRADEELRALEAAGIDYEIVPGITAALAAASVIRQPLTQRGVARSVAFVTRAQAIGLDAPRGESAAPEPAARADSLVYYMGREQATAIAAELIAQGRAPSTPAWVVEAATTPRQRAACFTLRQMADGAAAAWVCPESPSLLLIGAAFAVREACVESRPACSAPAARVA